MKQYFLIFISLIILAGCVQEDPSIPENSQSETAEISEVVEMTEIDQSKMLTFKIRDTITFDYPLGWQILTMSEFVGLESLEASYEKRFDLELSSFRSIDINFDRPHDIGPYDRSVDIAMRNVSFKNPPDKNPPDSLEEYMDITEEWWGQTGERETYASPQGIEFMVWQGQSSAYEANNVMYLTRHNGGFLEISRMGAGHDDIKKALQPVVDSLRFER